MWRLAAAAAAAALSLPAPSSGSAAVETPVQKVVTLLEKLRVQVQEEGTAEAASYDKFACFCKDQADQKTYALKKSQTIIDEHAAAIESLGAEITQLDQDAVGLKGDITSEEAEAEGTVATRNTAFDTYTVERQNLTQGIDAITNAIATLRASRDDVHAVKAAAALAQTARLLLDGAGSRSGFLSQQAPKAYEYRSGDVTQTLMELSKTFKQKLAELDELEAADRHQHNMVEGARANKIKALQASIDKKETLSAKKSEEKSERTKLHDDEVAARNADQSFLDELSTTCENKAKSWDERSKARAAELSAMTEAIGTLKGMGDLYDVNSKLVGLASTGATVSIHQHAQAAPSLLQMERRASSRSAGISHVVNILEGKAKSLHSSVLAQVALQLIGAEPVDHFVKVRGIINDLIARLEQEAINEADAKSLCDTQMTDAVGKRDTRQSEVEGYKADIAATSAEIKELESSITALAQEISGLYKALEEITALRKIEKDQNEKTVADANAGAVAIGEALVVLQNYYGSSGALLQRGHGAYVPPNSDRDGKTVSDLAPETFTENVYEGKVGESKGVIGLLEVIKADFERTSSTTAALEIEQQTAFETEETRLNTEIGNKETEKGNLETDKTNKEADLIGFEDSLKDAQMLHDTAIETLEKLKASCVDSSESWAERRQRREQEIEALKQALQILEDWKGF